MLNQFENSNELVSFKRCLENIKTERYLILRKLQILQKLIEVDPKEEAEVLTEYLADGIDKEDLEDKLMLFDDKIFAMEDILNTLKSSKKLDSTQRAYYNSIK